MNLKKFLPILLLGISSGLYAQTEESAQPAALEAQKLDTLSQSNPSFVADSVAKPVVDSVAKPTTQTVVPVEPSEVKNERPETPAAEQSTQSKSTSADMSSTLKGGLYIRLGIMNPSSSYMIENAKTGYNFQLGSQFYIGPVIANRLRFGLDVSWLDLSYAKLDVTDGHSGIVSALGVGPMVSVAPAKRFAITTYVKAMPSFDFAVGQEEMGFYDDGSIIPVSDEILKTVARGGFGVTGLWGIEARYSILDIGFDVRWGSHKFKEISGVDGFQVQSNTYKINNTRFYIGIRF